MTRRLGRVFAVPAILALTSTIGLVSALLDDGVYDVVSWAGLGLPVVVVAWAWVTAK